MYQITKALANLRKMKKKSAILSVDDMKTINSTIDLLEKADMKLEEQAEQFIITRKPILAILSVLL